MDEPTEYERGFKDGIYPGAKANRGGEVNTFQINRKTVKTKHASLSCAEIIRLAGKCPPETALYRKVEGGQPVRVNMHEVHTIIGAKYVTLPLDTTDG